MGCLGTQNRRQKERKEKKKGEGERGREGEKEQTNERRGLDKRKKNPDMKSDGMAEQG